MKLSFPTLKAHHVIINLLCLNAAVDAVHWTLKPSECKQIQRFKKKSIILSCPLLSMTTKTADDTPATHCAKAGCCYTPHQGKDLCWLNTPTYREQKSRKMTMKVREAEAAKEEEIAAHQRRQKELAIIALEEAELKREEEAIIKKEEQAIEKEIAEATPQNSSNEHDSSDDDEHKTFQLVHFGGAMDQNREKMERMDDNQKCLINIEQEIIQKGQQNSCIMQVEVPARVSCDVTGITGSNPALSLCSACKQKGCCFDPTPRIVNGRLAPMCFYTKTSEAPVSAIESDLIELQKFEEEETISQAPTEPTLSAEEQYQQGIMKQHGHATAAPDMMGVKYQPKRDNRYQDWIKQNYNTQSQSSESDETSSEAEAELSAAAAKMQELIKNNPRLAGKLGTMGISTSKPLGNKLSTPAMGAGGSPSGAGYSDRMQSFMSMYGSGKMPSMGAGSSSMPSSMSSMGGMPGGFGGAPSSSGSNAYMDKIKQQLMGGSNPMMNAMSAMGSSGSMPSMDKMQMLQSMLNGGSSSSSSSSKTSSSSAHMDKLKEMMGYGSSSTTSKPSTAKKPIEVAPEPEPEFNSALHANMYKKMMQSFKLNLSRSGKSPMQMQKDLDTFKRAVLKRFDKYLIKTTTAAPITTVAPDSNQGLNSLDGSDSGSNGSTSVVSGAKEFGSVAEFEDGTETSFVPFMFERFEIGNDEPNNCYPEQCGVPDLDSVDYLNTMKKIVGGTTAGSPAFWPWQVSIRRIYANTVNFSHLCGGTLISSKWILTAAHCFIRYTNLYYQDGVMEDRIDQFIIHVGRYHKSEVRGEDGLQMRTLEKYIAHENFSPTAKNQINDIALGKMLFAVDITEHVRPACLPSPDTPAREGDRMWITGWGDDMNVADSEVLKELSLPVASVEMCKNDWKSYYNDGWICSDRAYKEDACTGDSGGPAVHKTSDGRWRIVGITAAGSMKCSTTQASVKAGVFTNVSKFRRWIDVNTGGMC